MIEGKKYFSVLRVLPFNIAYHNVKRLRALFVEKVEELLPLKCKTGVSVSFSNKNKSAKCKFSITLGIRISDSTMPLVLDRISDAAIASLYTQIYEEEIEKSSKEAMSLASIYLPKKIKKVC